MTKTNSTTNAIIKFLNLNDFFVWRQNNAGIYDKSKNVFRASKTTLRGVSDIVGLKWDGTFIGIEIKTGNDRQSEFQKHFQKEIEKRNGIYIISKDFDDFLKQYEKILKK